MATRAERLNYVRSVILGERSARAAELIDQYYMGQGPSPVTGGTPGVLDEKAQRPSYVEPVGHPNLPRMSMPDPVIDR